MNRRTLLGGLGAAGLASLAGCLGVVGMDEHESSPAGVEASVREETGYEQTSIDEVVVEEEFSISAYSETISVTNYTTEYEKAVEIPGIGSQRAAVFTVFTSPQVSVAGQEFNPLQEMSTTELIGHVANSYDDISDISHEEDAEITILDETTPRSRFSADATFNGHDLEVDIHVSEAVEAGEDLLVTIGVYPEQASGEEENVLSLMEGVDPDAADEEADVDGGENGGDSNETDGEDGESDGDNNASDDGTDGPLGSVS